MAQIEPIRGLRYNQEAVSDLSLVVTPPYDVIDDKAQSLYYQRHPYNIIRLEYCKSYPTDDQQQNRYSRAADTFANWRAQNILTQENEPALYLYEQQFVLQEKVYRRKAFFAGLKVEPYKAGNIKPHEETLPHAKQDRLSLLRTCRANFSPIFGIYAEKNLEAINILTQAASSQPTTEFQDELGQCHRLWVITNKEAIREVQELLKHYPVFIADGHHRYETALSYAQECNRPGAHNYILAALVSLHDPGLVILPTHRLVKYPSGVDFEQVYQKLQERFTVTHSISSLECLMNLLSSSPRHSFGFFTAPDNFYLLTPKPDFNLLQYMPSEQSTEWKKLDVSILHHLILQDVFTLDKNAWGEQEFLKYTRAEADALEQVQTGTFDCAFFLKPPGKNELIAVSKAGERMPQKSTYFYPKLSTGLVIHAFD